MWYMYVVQVVESTKLQFQKEFRCSTAAELVHITVFEAPWLTVSIMGGAQTCCAKKLHMSMTLDIVYESYPQQKI